MPAAARGKLKTDSHAPKTGRGARQREFDSYLEVSQQPLHVLIFLLPLVILYELGATLFLTGGEPGAIESIRAYRLLAEFFHAFGVGGIYLPGIARVVVLLVWHLLRRDSWRVRWPALVAMLAESMFWTAPLLVLGQMIGSVIRSAQAHAAAPVAIALAAAPSITDLSWPARATLAVGAGLYEELLFRFVAITAIHFVAVDLLTMKDHVGKVVAVVLAAAAFALYHDVALDPGSVDFPRLAFYFAAGIYFGVIFALRGFGVVVAVHVIYDLVVLLLAN
ncbi:MAG: CPBP family glutamic-type intramembrane protease [Planctomycetota bacterium]|nr:CPBP family glutamic-type intramembrane protease [Planctomycetota bacterium]